MSKLPVAVMIICLFAAALWGYQGASWWWVAVLTVLGAPGFLEIPAVRRTALDFAEAAANAGFLLAVSCAVLFSFGRGASHLL